MITEQEWREIGRGCPVPCSLAVARAYLELLIDRSFTAEEWQEILVRVFGHKPDYNPPGTLPRS